ncbi:hypothetical protein SNE40_010389 [Patella caerulea]|uniref:Kinesin motor domain-containing protein n=1 Tax=Patella caerulea TaxID=87958 RepID=A0AAN8JU58_PATCE
MADFRYTMNGPPSYIGDRRRPLSRMSEKYLPPSTLEDSAIPPSQPPPGLRTIQSGVCCEHCNNCLIDLKRQALRIMFPVNSRGEPRLPSHPVSYMKVEEKLQVPDNFRRYVKRERCDVCETPIRQLKQEAVAMIQSIQQAQSASSVPANIPALVGSYNIGAHQRNHQPNRYLSRSSKSSQYSSCVSSGIPLAAQAQAYLEQNAQSWLNPVNRHNQVVNARTSGHDRIYMELNQEIDMGSHGCSSLTRIQHGSHARCNSPAEIGMVDNNIFSRAAQKISKKKKRHQPPDPEPPPFPTNFCDIIRSSPPPAPPCLARGLGRLLNPGAGKVRVILKICSPIVPGQQEQGRSFLTIDPRRKQVTVHDPSASGYMTSASRRSAVAAPKMFAFDGIFSPDDSLPEVCAGSLSDILQSVVSGADGCLFSYGHSKLGKSFTMVGKDHSPQTLGVIPCAIAWLFKLISDQKETTGARFSVRVSAVEVSGAQEILKDLLVDFSKGVDGCESNGVYLREDPICGTQLENQSELRAPNAERAAFYFDAALAARNKNVEEDGRSSHLLFTLHVYQYRIEKANRAGLPGVAGGRSRLHLIDLGSTARSKDPKNTSLSLSALGNIIMALLNGQRHLPHRDSKIAQLLRDSLGNTTCRTCIIVHVSSALPHHAETLQVVQMAARMHRMKRRKAKISSTSSEDSSTDGSGNFRRPYKGLRMGTLREDMFVSSSHSDPDNYTSSSEQSCDTAIFLGSSGQSLSDRDFTDNEGPHRSVPRTNPRLPRRPGGSRSSGDEGSMSDSGRSMTYSDHQRLRPRMGASPMQQNHYHVIESQSAPCSPQRHPNYTQHKMSQVKSKQFHPHYLSSLIEAEPHQDRSRKIRSHSSKHQKSVGTSAGAVNSEHWVDGPIYAEPMEVDPKMNSQKVHEHWIDGPQVFKKSPQSPKPDSSNRKKLKNVVVSSEERWIDGPREMISSGSQSTNKNQAMHTLSTVNDNQVPSSPSPKLKHATTGERALKQAIIKQIPDIKIRPESSISVESNTSTHAEAATSRPVSISSNDGQMKDCIDISENMVVKPFVRDWVEKHHDVPNSIESSDNHWMDNNENTCSHKKTKLHDSLLRKLHTSASNVRDSPQNSPMSGRKAKTLNPRLHKSNLSKEKHYTNRVTEWVKSVSNEMEQSSELERHGSVPCKLNVTFDSGEPEVNIVDTSYDSVDTSDCVSAKDSNYEHDVEKKLENVSNSWITPDNSIGDTDSNMKHSADGDSYTDMPDNDNSCSVLEPCRLLLLRKPDGASNPNLSKDFFSETCGITSEHNESTMTCNQLSGYIPEKTTSTVLSGYKPEKELFPGVGAYDNTNTNLSVKTVKTKPSPVHGLVKLSTVQLPSSLKSSQPAAKTFIDMCSSPERKNVKNVAQFVPSKCNEREAKTSKSASKKTCKKVHLVEPQFIHSTPKEKCGKKEKEMLITQRIVNVQLSEKHNDSDSGNDSGIVAAVEKKLLSPYSKITKPRTPSHSSSGHGSDNSSSLSTELHCHRGSKSDKIHGGTSSGYESMLRESEASCSDTEDIKLAADKKKNTLRKGGKRSRSAPSRAIEVVTLDTCNLSPISKMKPTSPYRDSRLAAKLKDSHLEMKTMTVKEAEKYQRRRYEEEHLMIVEEDVKTESTKDTISLERSSGWNFSCKFWMCFSCKKPRDQEPTAV